MEDTSDIEMKAEEIMNDNNVNYRIFNDFAFVFRLLNDDKLLIKLNNKDYLGIINGYKDGLIKVENIDKNIEIKNNEIVVTSGMEKGIPRGIVIGSILKEENSKYDLSKTIYIKSNVDFNNIHYVSVIGDKNE